MLATLRKASHSFAIKLLMVVLLCTFVLWGVGDMLRSGPSNYVLKVGDTKVSEMEFGNLYREQLAVIQQQFGHEFTKEELNDPQLKQVVVNQMVNRLLQKKIAQDMKFAVSDDMVKFEIAGMPMFTRDGRFDKELFDGYLRNVGLSEAKFVELLREDLSSQNIGLLFSVLRFEPALLTDTLLKARGQTRVVNMVTIPKTALAFTEQPTDADLQRVFEENKAKFIIPEKREISYVVFGPEIAQIDTVTDKVLKEFYESKKQTFTEPEKRKVQQMVFKDKAAGELALKDLKKGMLFEEVGKKNFPDKKSFLIGELTKNGLSSDIAKVIFTLPVDKPSDLVQSPMGHHIFIVESITPAKVKEFAEIKDKLRDVYLEEKRYEKLNEIAQSVDKEILAGKTLSNIAKDFNFKPQNLVVVSNVDDKDMLKFQGFKSAVFSTDEGSVSTVMPLEGQDKYFLVAVNKVYPATAKQFAQVKLEVFKLWQDGRAAERLTDISQDVYKTLASGAKIDATVKKFGLNAPKIMNLSLLSDSTQKMPYEFLKEAFALKVGGCTHPVKGDKKDYMIACVAEIIDADLTQLKDKRAGISMEFMQSVPNELMGQLLRNAKEKYKVEMNNKYLEELEF